jgi:hypothetical protein
VKRRLLAAVAVVAVVGLGAAGVYAGLPGDDANPGPQTATPTPSPTAVPTTTPTATQTSTPDGPVVLTTGEDGRLVLETAEGQVVRGETTLEPGTTLLVRLRSSDSAHPFLHSTETAVREDGSFRATFDLSAVEGSGTFDVVVRRGDEVLLRTTGELEAVETDDEENASDSKDGTSDEEDGPYAAFVTADAGNVTLRATDRQVVRGETTLPTGTDLVVRLRSAGENPFLKTAGTTVESDGTFRATFNASNLEAGANFEAAVLRDGETLATAPGEVVAPEPHAEASFAYEGERLTLANASGQVVRGKTDLDAGETVLVRMHSGGATPFIKSSEATVRENGTFRATFDMSNVPEGTTFRAFVSHDDERLTEAPGEVAADA